MNKWMTWGYHYFWRATHLFLLMTLPLLVRWSFRGVLELVIISPIDFCRKESPESEATLPSFFCSVFSVIFSLNFWIYIVASQDQKHFSLQRSCSNTESPPGYDQNHSEDWNLHRFLDISCCNEAGHTTPSPEVVQVGFWESITVGFSCPWGIEQTVARYT